MSLAANYHTLFTYLHVWEIMQLTFSRTESIITLTFYYAEDPEYQWIKNQCYHR